MKRRFNITVIIITLLTFLMAGCDQPQPVNNEGRCDFNDVSLPKKAVVYAVGTSLGKSLIWQIDDRFPRESSEVEVFINEPKKPVILMLVGDMVDVWQIKRTPKTKIVAIYVGNALPNPKVLGISETIPVVVATGWDDQCEDVKSQFGVTDVEMEKLDGMASQLFKRSITQKFAELTAERIYVGKQLPDTEYIQDRVQPTESLRIPNTPLVTQAGLDEAIRDGIIRVPTQEEINQWYRDGVIPKEQWSIEWVDDHIKLDDPIYLILKPFQIPAGLSGTRGVQYVLPKGVPMPTGELGNSTLFDLNAQQCFTSSLMTTSRPCIN